MDLLQENALGVKVPSGETILTKYLNGYTANVVVTGNEYADLNGDSPLAAGKTQVDGKTTLNWSTDLDAIGEAYTVWATKGGANNNDTVIYASNDGLNTVEEINTATNKLAKEVSLTLNDDTAYFVNFGDGVTYTASEYKIKYVIDLSNSSAGLTPTEKTAYVEDNGGEFANDDDESESSSSTYTKTIKPDNALTDTDIKNIQAIFDGADKAADTKEVLGTYDIGEVYVGTQSTEDISDTLSFKQFKAKYLTSSKEDTKITSNDNGNYVKVIDNDGDGVAEYVLQTKYFLDEISKIKTSGPSTTYTFVGSKITTSGDDADTIAPQYEDAAAGDVVVAALIDGVAYLYKADSSVETVKTYSFAKNTITTTDGNTYEESGIGNQTKYAETLSSMSDKTEYEIFFDLFGNVRAYRLLDSTTSFALLTEAYTTNSQNGKYVSGVTATVEAKLGSADTAEYNVVNYNAKAETPNEFFTAAYATGKNDQAGRPLYSELNTAFKSTSNKAKTNVAIYTESDDGLTITSTDVVATDRSGRTYYYTDGTKTAKTVEYTAGLVAVYATKSIELDETKAITAKQWYYTGKSENVNAVHDTEYYIVDVETGRISYFTDYANVPDIAADKIKAAYAVAENTNADKNSKDYWVADVIVIEVANWQNSYESVSLAYYTTQRTSDTVRSVNALDNVASDVAVTIVPKTQTWLEGFTKGYGFYTTYNTTTTEDGEITVGSLSPISGNYNSYGIYAGTIDYMNEVAQRGDYIVVDGEKVVVYNVPVYSVTTNGRGVTNAEQLDINEDLAAGDKIIYVKNKAQNAVSFIIKVTGYTAPDAVSAFLNDTAGLWKAISDEQNQKTEAAKPTLTIKSTVENATIDPTSLKMTADGTITIKPDTGYEFTAATDVTVTLAGSGATVTAPTKVETDGSLKITVADITANDTVVITGKATGKTANISSTALTTALSGATISGAQINGEDAADTSAIPTTAKVGDVITFTITDTTDNGATNNGAQIMATGIDDAVGTLADGVTAADAVFTKVAVSDATDFAVQKALHPDNLYTYTSDDSTSATKVASDAEYSAGNYYWYKSSDEVAAKAATATVRFEVTGTAVELTLVAAAN
jgi:hypothetical protein